MSALTISSSSAVALRADAVVVGVGTVDGADILVLASGGESVGRAFDGRLPTLLETLGASGSEGEITRLPAPEGVQAEIVLAVGLGTAPEDDASHRPETLRRAAGAAARALAGTRTAVFALPAEDADSLAAVAEGALLGAYAFRLAGSESGKDAKSGKGAASDKSGKAGASGKAGKGGKDRSAPLAEITLAGADPDDPAHQAAVARAEVLAAEVNRARDLVNAPPNDLTPEDFARSVKAAAKEHSASFAVLDEKALVRDGYGGILGVGQGSQAPPRLVRLAHTHPAAKRTLALVGKGITYDSGGISLKPAGSNETMKCDMSGAAAVAATVLAAARLQLPVNVTGWLALAENMPSGSATRPGDVLRMYSGKTVEVLNTDAEGRLVLADALTRACEDKPDAVVDVATLTGAMVLALGNRTFGILSDDEGFREALQDTAEQAGEESWPMPMPAELRSGLDSTVADLSNVGERMGGGLTAGIFLKEFVAKDVVWAHLDIAGPAFHEGAPFGYTPKGGTGTGVRTLLRLLERAAAGELDPTLAPDSDSAQG